MITPAQCRAARALLDWSRERLCEQAGIGESDLERFEAGDDGLPPRDRVALKRVLGEGGVLFFDEDETVNGGAGVRLRRSRPLDEGLRPEHLTTENDL